jgi:hypothetical protein
VILIGLFVWIDFFDEDKTFCIENNFELLHNDHDFKLIEKHLGLRSFGFETNWGKVPLSLNLEDTFLVQIPSQLSRTPITPAAKSFMLNSPLGV